MFHLLRAAAGGAALLLVVAGAVHLVRPGRFRRVLTAQSIVPRRLVPATAVVAGGAELSCGLAVALLLASGGGGLTAALAAQAVLFGAYAGYLGLLVRRRSTAPCGCLGDGAAATPAVVWRAVLLAAPSALAALGGGPIPAAWLGPAAATAGLGPPPPGSCPRSCPRRGTAASAADGRAAALELHAPIGQPAVG